MSEIRDQVITTAEKHLGWRWVHNCRSNGEIDCVGLLANCADSVNYKISLPKAYSSQPRFNSLQQHIEKNFSKTTSPVKGDIILFNINDLHNHVGLFISPSKFIHARYKSKGRGRVEYGSFTENAFWSSKIACFYDLLSYQ